MKYWISVLIGAMSYGILSTIVVHAYDYGFTLGEVVGSQLLVGFLLAWLLVAGLSFFGKRKRNKSSERKQEASWKQRLLLMLAGTPSAITGLLYYHSLTYIPASLAIIMLFQFSWIGVAIQAAIEKRMPGKSMLFALAVLLIGTVLAAGINHSGESKFHPYGIGLGLLSAVSYSLMILLSGKAAPRVHPAKRSAWMSTGALLLVFVLFPPYFLINGQLWEGLLLFGAMLGLFGAFLPPLLYAAGIPHIGEGMASIVGAAELPVAVLLSTFVLHEEVAALQWCGVLLVLLGIALPELAKRYRSLTRQKQSFDL
ncbi:DMT family transporter [Paenibacillus sp. NEAU-GSW1]|uniref:EamA family transporter n=1 Tax=Paenibacillus sp. NEAU-GSW1 TaxID=2682486 RepID=UPI0012E1C88D|nr:DMT family transporter [Paenibacillus sp. NEAU-GSW1]MUT67019.1 EamA family transporter [Paenibacillus sp. NEAU-GSW1]